MDHALTTRRALIESATSPVAQVVILESLIERAAKHLDNQRAKAIKTLGDNWVMSPNYEPSMCEHHNQRVKSSAVLNVFMRIRKAHEMGRV